MAKKKKDRKARRLQRKSIAFNNLMNQKEKEPLTPKRTSSHKKEQEQEKGKVEETMHNLIPRDLKIEYDKSTKQNVIIDANTGEVVDKVTLNGYDYDDDYKKEYKEFKDEFFKGKINDDYTYSESVIASFFDYIKDIPHKIRIRVEHLVIKARVEQGVESVAYALHQCEDLWDICVRHKFSSDDVLSDFATQFLNYLPEASTQWIKDTMDEFEFHEGINDY